MNKEVRKRLEEGERRQVEWQNKGDASPKNVGDWAWYRNPRDGTSDFHGAWIGRFEVRMRTSTQDYVSWAAKRELEIPASVMKRWFGPVYGALEVPLRYEKLPRGVDPVFQDRIGLVDRVDAHLRSPQG